LRSSSQELERLCANQGQTLAAIDPRFQFGHLSSVEEAVRVSIHEFLKSLVRLCGESKSGDLLDEFDWGLD
jgi:hypothetical protein